MSNNPMFDIFNPAILGKDMVEVVRCKECKHFTAINDVWGRCSAHNDRIAQSCDFCSCGERRDDE